MNNRELADQFKLIADLLEIKGEVVYKVLAYRKVADSLNNLTQDVNELWKEGRLEEIPGVGKAIAEKIDELLSTGKLEFLERLKNEVPPSLTELLQVPDVGPRKAALFWKELGITDLAGLEAAAREGKLRSLPGMGEKSEARILAGLEALARRGDRIPIGEAWPLAQELLAFLRKLPGVVAAEPAGSLRRMRSTVGDIDLLVASKNPAPVMAAFTGRKDVVRVLASGETKSSVEFANGLRSQIWIHPPERFGTALVYATGSKDHNVRLRELALTMGLSLSEHSFQRKDGSEILCDNEEKVYETLGLQWIPPELREDHGEVQAAKAGKLPRLITHEDLVSDLQTHSTWSDGKLSILEMAKAARERGFKLLAITDHTPSLGVTGGVKIEDLARQRAEIDAAQEKLGDSIRILQGAEVEIRADGRLDYPDEVLAKLDIVLASVHTSLRQPRDQVTARMIAAIRNPHVDIIAHPTGRLFPNREGADLDLEAIFSEARKHGVALEINAHPARLDLDDANARRAMELGILLTINSDAHSPADFDLAFFGVAIARRAWVTPEAVLNAWPVEKQLDWLKNRGG